MHPVLSEGEQDITGSKFCSGKFPGEFYIKFSFYKVAVFSGAVLFGEAQLYTLICLI